MSSFSKNFEVILFFCVFFRVEKIEQGITEIAPTLYFNKNTLIIRCKSKEASLLLQGETLTKLKRYINLSILSIDYCHIKGENILGVLPLLKGVFKVDYSSYDKVDKEKIKHILKEREDLKYRLLIENGRKDFSFFSDRGYDFRYICDCEIDSIPYKVVRGLLRNGVKMPIRSYILRALEERMLCKVPWKVKEIIKYGIDFSKDKQLYDLMIDTYQVRFWNKPERKSSYYKRFYDYLFTIIVRNT